MQINNIPIIFMCFSFLMIQKDGQCQLSKRKIEIIDTSLKSGIIYFEKSALDEYIYYFNEKEDSLIKEFENFRQWKKFRNRKCKQLFLVSDCDITNHNQTSSDSLNKLPLFCNDKSTQISTIKSVSNDSFFEINALFVKSWFYRAKLDQGKNSRRSFLVWACTFRPARAVE